MKSRREQKAELMALAEEQIELLLEWAEGRGEPDLEAVEEEVLRIRQILSEKMTEVVVNSQESVRPVPGPSCCKCGQEMHYKGMKPKEVTSWVGEIKLERGYYYCDHCRGGLFPPGQAVGVAGTELQ